MLYGDENIQGGAEVFDEVHRQIKEYFSKGYDVIYDATNLKRKHRVHILNMIKKYTDNTKLILVATPVIHAFKNNGLRERQLLNSVIERQANSFQPPYYDEGWKDIKIYYAKKDFYSQFGTVHVLRKYQNLSYIDHDNPYHTGTIGEHIDSVVDNIDIEMKDYAFLHDIGKYYTKQLKLGAATYYGHEYRSAYISLFYGIDSLTDIEILMRAYVISLHMRIHSMDAPRYNKFLESLPLEIKDRLIELNNADKKGT